MALRIDLKPFEQLIIGKAVLQNGPERINFAISGAAPVLRVKDALGAGDARTPKQRLQFVMQTLYLEESDAETERPAVYDLARDIFLAEPVLVAELEAIIAQFESGDYFKALKNCIRIAIEPQSSASKVRRKAASDGRRP